MRDWMSRTSHLLMGLLPLFGILAIWQLINPVNSPYFPAPDAWWHSLVKQFQAGQLLAMIGNTLRVFAISIFASSLIGIILGIVIGLNPRIAKALSPLLEFLRNLPPPVLVPIAILLMGYSKSLQVLVVTSATVWPIIIATANAVKLTHPLLRDVALTLHLSRFRTIRDIVFPSALPAILMGIKVAIPIAIVVTLLIEMITLMPGIGSLIVRAQREFRSAEVYGLLILVGMLGFMLNHGYKIIERSIMQHWPPSASDDFK